MGDLDGFVVAVTDVKRAVVCIVVVDDDEDESVRS